MSAEMMRPYVSSAPTIERSWLEPPTAPKSGPTSGSTREVMSVRCTSRPQPTEGHGLAGKLRDGAEPHVVAGVRRLKDLAVSDVDRDVVRRRRSRVCEEDEIAGLLVVPTDWAPEGDLRARVVRQPELPVGCLIGGVHDQ